MDARGKTVSLDPVGRVRSEFERLPGDQVVELVTDRSPAIDSDLHAWANLTGHSVQTVTTEDDHRRYHLRRSGDSAGGAPSVALVLSDPGLAELLTPLGFALAAAQSGGEVHIFFQGPAVRVLKEGFRGRLHGVAGVFSGFARRGMAKAGHPEPHDKLREIVRLGGKLYVCGASMTVFGVDADQLAFESVTISEYFTFLPVLRDSNIALVF